MVSMTTYSAAILAALVAYSAANSISFDDSLNYVESPNRFRPSPHRPVRPINPYLTDDVSEDSLDFGWGKYSKQFSKKYCQLTGRCLTGDLEGSSVEVSERRLHPYSGKFKPHHRKITPRQLSEEVESEEFYLSDDLEELTFNWKNAAKKAAGWAKKGAKYYCKFSGKCLTSEDEVSEDIETIEFNWKKWANKAKDAAKKYCQISGKCLTSEEELETEISEEGSLEFNWKKAAKKAAGWAKKGAKYYCKYSGKCISSESTEEAAEDDFELSDDLEQLTFNWKKAAKKAAGWAKKGAKYYCKYSGKCLTSEDEVSEDIETIEFNWKKWANKAKDAAKKYCQISGKCLTSEEELETEISEEGSLEFNWKNAWKKAANAAKKAAKYYCQFSGKCLSEELEGEIVEEISELAEGSERKIRPNNSDKYKRHHKGERRVRPDSDKSKRHSKGDRKARPDSDKSRRHRKSGRKSDSEVAPEQLSEETEESYLSDDLEELAFNWKNAAKKAAGWAKKGAKYYCKFSGKCLTSEDEVSEDIETIEFNWKKWADKAKNAAKKYCQISGKCLTAEEELETEISEEGSLEFNWKNAWKKAANAAKKAAKYYCQFSGKCLSEELEGEDFVSSYLEKASWNRYCGFGKGTQACRREFKPNPYFRD